MTFERWDWWWTIGMSIVCRGLDKRVLVRTVVAVLGALVGACFGTSNFATY
jgi:hypothetical protein